MMQRTLRGIRSWRWLLVCGVLAACAAEATGPGGDPPEETGPQPFSPSSNTTLEGQRSFTSVEIPAGVTVTVTGDLTLSASEAVSIAGALVGDCVALTVSGEAAVEITGTVGNACSSPPAGTAPGLALTSDGELRLDGATLESSGDGLLRTDPTLSKDEFPGADRVEGKSLVVAGSMLRSVPERASPGATGQAAADGVDGADWLLLSRDALTVDAGSEIRAQAGGDGGAATFAGEVPADGPVVIRGGAGGSGGSVGLLAAGELRLGDGAAAGGAVARVASLGGLEGPVIAPAGGGAGGAARLAGGIDDIPAVADLRDHLSAVPGGTDIIYAGGDAGRTGLWYLATGATDPPRDIVGLIPTNAGSTPFVPPAPGPVFGGGLPGLDATADGAATGGGRVIGVGGAAPSFDLRDLPLDGTGLESRCMIGLGSMCAARLQLDQPERFELGATLEVPSGPSTLSVSSGVELQFGNPDVLVIRAFERFEGQFARSGGDVSLRIGDGGAGSIDFLDGAPGGTGELFPGPPPPAIDFFGSSGEHMLILDPTGDWGRGAFDGGDGGPGGSGCMADLFGPGGPGGEGGQALLGPPATADALPPLFDFPSDVLLGGPGGDGDPPGEGGEPGPLAPKVFPERPYEPVQLSLRSRLSGRLCDSPFAPDDIDGTWLGPVDIAGGNPLHDPHVLNTGDFVEPRTFRFSVGFRFQKLPGDPPTLGASAAAFRAALELTVTGPEPTPELTGQVDDVTGEFRVTGTGLVAGIPGVLVVMEGAVRLDGTLSAELTFGADGKLPGGEPIVYSFEAEKQ